MTDFSLTDFALTYMVTYGPMLLGAILLSGALGLPLPGTLLVIAAGAFVRQGVMDLSQTLLLGLVGVGIGDSLSYGIGRYARGWLEGRMGNSSAWLLARDSFIRQAGIAIYLTRFLITPLAIPTNLVAGSSGYAYWRFLTFDLLGEITWLALYGGVGYLFGSQWEVVADFASNFSGLLAGLALFGLGLYFYHRRRVRKLAAAVVK